MTAQSSHRPAIRVVLAAFALSLLVAPAAATAELVDRIIAVVNKDIILQSELDEVMDYVVATELRGLSGERLEEAKGELLVEMLDGLIANKLIEQAMDRAQIEVSDREVEAAIADVASQNGITTERLFEELEKQGMDEVRYRMELKKQIRQYQFMNLEIRGRVSVSEDDIRAAWVQRSAGIEPEPAWRLQRMLLSFPADDPEGAEAVRGEAAVLFEELAGGKDFAEVARARSDDASTKEAGGDAGIFKPRDLSSLFADALSAAEVGEAVLVEVPTGIFILKIVEEVDAARKSFEEVRDAIARDLYDDAMERELDLWTAEERRKAHVESFI